MTRKALLLDTGVKELDTTIYSGHGARRRERLTDSPASESIGDLSTRVYGYDTAGARDSLIKANSSLDGLVRIPNP